MRDIQNIQAHPYKALGSNLTPMGDGKSRRHGSTLQSNMLSTTIKTNICLENSWKAHWICTLSEKDPCMLLVVYSSGSNTKNLVWSLLQNPRRVDNPCSHNPEDDGLGFGLTKSVGSNGLALLLKLKMERVL